MLSPTAPPDTLSRPLWRQVLALALPALAQQYLHLVVQLSDQFLAGRFELPDPNQRIGYLSALNTAGYLYWFVSSYTVLVSVGSTALVARFVGAKDWALAQHATGQSVVLAVVFGLLGTVAALLGLPSLIEALKLTGDAAHLCVEFLTPLAVLLAFQITESACAACLAGAGDTRTGLKVLGLVAVLNVPLAWGLCFGVGPIRGIGFVGIALGTGISHVIGCVLLLVILSRGKSGLKLRLANLLPAPRLIRRLLRVSVPAAIDSLSAAFCQLWFLSLVNSLGDTAASAHGIALKWEALGFLSGAAFGTAAMALVGQNLGARTPDRAARSGWTAYALGGGVMSFMGLLFVLLAEHMFRLFCPDPSLQPIVDAGVPALRLIACAMPALASQIIFTAALRGAGDSRVPVLFSWFGFLCVRIPLAHLLTAPQVNLGSLGTIPGYDLGLLGAWVAMCSDLWARGTFFAIRFASGKWKKVEV
ncbi:Multidrug export protein MepA [Gemmata sp. SH-PL17]|uniref:MATE family efflux transporter n=1 Tax=Gemmata sp. SH-PL17 TaxID=1630693 RepID=UPI0004BCEE8B|nr:MATE family efflux transporter [Gemmata sp. SH-PL17]AMV23898.1 Multidrug export protein MepA [Gemmata sp. SH-PL17]